MRWINRLQLSGNKTTAPRCAERKHNVNRTRLLDIDAALAGIRNLVGVADDRRKRSPIGRHIASVHPACVAGVESVRTTDSFVNAEVRDRNPEGGDENHENLAGGGSLD